MMEEPASHFLRAKESLLKNNKKEAARNIRKGVNVINIEITRAVKNMKPKLSNVAGELLIFAQDLINNKEIATGGLERAFLRAESILSQHKLAMADIFILEDSLSNAVYALEAAGRHLLYSQIWSPRKLSNEDAESIKVAQEKMLHFIDGEKWDREQIISTINLLKQMLDKI